MPVSFSTPKYVYLTTDRLPAAHEGRQPYINPAPSVRWAWGESQPDSVLDDALKNKTISTLR